jgi:RNA polymerase sigma factor (sigma-70 family)
MRLGVDPVEVPGARVAGFQALFEDRYVPMVRLSRLLVDRVEVAEDIVQDAMAVVFRRWEELDNPAGYLRLTVINRSRDELRRRRVRDRASFVAELVHDSPDEMGDAIAALPESQRVAIVLRFYEDLSVKDIASVMGARPGTVKSWLHRAMRQLEEVIDR